MVFNHRRKDFFSSSIDRGMMIRKGGDQECDRIWYCVRRMKVGGDWDGCRVQRLISSWPRHAE